MNNNQTITLQNLLLQLYQGMNLIDDLARAILSLQQQQQDTNQFIGYLGRVEKVDDISTHIAALEAAVVELPINTRILAQALDGHIWIKNDQGIIQQQSFIQPVEVGNILVEVNGDNTLNQFWRVRHMDDNHIDWERV